MSSQTEETVETGANVDELAKLGIEQLEHLRDDHARAGNDDAAGALQKLIDERKRLEDKLAEQEAKQAKKKEPKPSRKGSRAPKGRQIKAAESFNQDPENLARLKRILEGDPNHDPPIEPVIQADGSYRMTPWLVQLGISGYYDERRREDKADAKPAEPAPIIPPAAEATGESDPSGETAPAAEAPVAETPAAPAAEVEAPAAPAAEVEGAETSTSEVTTEVEQVEATTPPMPINPYGTDPDDE